MALEPAFVGNSDRYGVPFYIGPEARRRHVSIFGASGAGKSAMLCRMIAGDILAGHGVTVVDPHGQLVNDLLDKHIPKSRLRDVIYLKASDPHRGMAVNLFDAGRPDQHGLIVSNALGIFRTLYADSWGQRMDDIFRNALFALLEQPFPVSLIALPPFLTDAGFRGELLGRVRNPIVLDFFHNAYDRWANSFREEAISPVLNKVRPFLTDPLLRAIVGKAPSSFDFRWAMDTKKIILCDVSKGAIGNDSARLLGSLIVMKEKLAAFSRGDIPEADRVPHLLYVEEAHNFIADFESILSETRKYALTLTIATQGIEQLPPKAAEAVFTNCATLISFRVSAPDAGRLQEEMVVGSLPVLLQDLADYRAYVRTLVCDADGCEPTDPERIATVPPAARAKRMARRQTVVRLSDERYTRPRAEIEGKIARFLKRKPREGQKPRKR
jgi:DNA helicase HerA-like ATPase